METCNRDIGGNQMTLLLNCIPADELYKIIPVMTVAQTLIVGAVLGPILIVTVVFAVRFIVKYVKAR